MLLSCWSAKGGSGTTVVAASLALVLARTTGHDALLVDLGGASRKKVAFVLAMRFDGIGAFRLTRLLSPAATQLASKLGHLSERRSLASRGIQDSVCADE